MNIEIKTFEFISIVLLLVGDGDNQWKFDLARSEEFSDRRYSTEISDEAADDCAPNSKQSSKFTIGHNVRRRSRFYKALVASILIRRYEETRTMKLPTCFDDRWVIFENYFLARSIKQRHLHHRSPFFPDQLFAVSSGSLESDDSSESC